MTSSPDIEGAPPLPQKSRRWPGILFSLIVPGFGLARAGFPGRAVKWFLGVYLVGFLAAFILASESFPISAAVIAFVAILALQIWMCCDSFRPGRMNWKLWCLLAILGTAIIWGPHPARFIARSFMIPTGAMEPTLMGTHPGSTADHIIVNRLSYLFSPPQRGDLLVFATSSIPAINKMATPSSEEVFYIKRVIGLPGEKIEIVDHAIHVNGVKMGPADGIPLIPFVNKAGTTTDARRDYPAFIVGPDEYFVLGDNSPNSYDSRFWGGVPASAVYGKITKIYYPFARAGRPVYPTH